MDWRESMTPKLTFKNIIKHWKKIRLHRKWVRHYCFLAGIPWRGITHDLSKYSPIEFFESARYYVGTSSPIDAAKKDKGYSAAWLHHKGRNHHHWAYWSDEFSKGTIIYPMPKNDFVELICDFVGAAHAYSEHSFSYYNELKWWKKDRENGNKAMNPINKRMVDIILHDLAAAELDKHISPEELIKSRYIQQVWKANSHVDENDN